MKRVILVLMAAMMALPFSMDAKSRKPADIKVISYNIRVGTAKDGTNSWEYRYPASAMMIMDQKPDIFGVQEALDFQVKYLEEYCPGYESVGVGREDGKSRRTTTPCGSTSRATAAAGYSSGPPNSPPHRPSRTTVTAAAWN